MNMFLDKLKESPKEKPLNLAIIISSIPFILLTLLFSINEVILETSTGYGILDFELAWTPDMINTIFNAWGSTVMLNQVLLHYIDDVFAIVYALFASLCILKISRKSKDRILDFGLIMFFMPILAGICDLIENTNLLFMLNNETSFLPINPLFASIFAVIKISFIISAICFSYAVSLLLIFRKYNIKISYYTITLIISAVLIVLLCSLWNLLFSLILGTICLIIIIYISYLVKNES